MAHSDNRILDALPLAEQAALKPILSGCLLKQHFILFEANASIEYVHFPIDAAISLVVPMSDGSAIESAMVGHDGVVGASAVLNGSVSLSRAIVQLEGASQRCSVNELKSRLPDCPTLALLLHRHEHVLFGQAQQSAACNVSHTLPSRLARWLLRARDLRGSDELKLTQEFIAEMLGVGRTSVSLTAHTLQQAGVIKYRRGHISIDHPDILKEMACECYEAVRLHYESLKAPAASNA